MRGTHVGNDTASRGHLEHPAMLYRGAREYVEGVVGFLRDGGDVPALVAVPGPQADLLRPHMNDLSDRTEFVDMHQLGRNPRRIIPAIREFVRGHPNRRVDFVGEPIWPGRSPAEVAEATQHESLLNLAFGDTPMRILCPYDVGQLDTAVLDDALRTHPAVIEGGELRDSPQYTDPVTLCESGRWPLPAPPTGTLALAFEAEHLGQVRRVVRQRAARAGLAHVRVHDLLLAINEAATNTLLHGPGRGILRVWQEPGALVCEIRDRGRIDDLLADRGFPADEAEGGWGFLLVNQLCDLVELRSDAGGTTVRMHMSL
jgi:anti-sigma regulatory factor (Ser/Thr protein kinase)